MDLRAQVKDLDRRITALEQARRPKGKVAACSWCKQPLRRGRLCDPCEQKIEQRRLRSIEAEDFRHSFG